MPFPAARARISTCRQRRRRFGRRAGKRRGSSDPFGRTLAACSTSPRLRGDVGAERRGRGSPQAARTWAAPPPPTLSPQAGRGSTPSARLRRWQTEGQRLPLRNELGVEIGAEALDAAFAAVAGFLPPAERRLRR